MTWADDDKKLAKGIVENEAIMSLLYRVLVEPREQISAERAVSMPNADLGELVKADALAQAKIEKRFADLKRLPDSLPSNKPPTPVPR